MTPKECARNLVTHLVNEQCPHRLIFADCRTCRQRITEEALTAAVAEEWARVIAHRPKEIGITGAISPWDAAYCIGYNHALIEWTKAILEGKA